MSNYPWYVDFFIDVVTLALAGMWMGWTYSTVQQRGPSALLLVTSLTVILVLVLLVYRQRLTYLQLGDRVVIGFEDGREGEGEPTDWQEENR